MKNKPFKIKYLYLFCVILLITGFFYGTIIYNDFGFLVSKNYLENFILRENYAEKPSMWTMAMNLLDEFSYFFILWFLSLTIIGIIILVFVIFFVGFMYGFTIRYFISTYTYQGVTISFLYTFPKNIILIPLMIYFTAQAIVNAVQIFGAIYTNTNKRNLKMVVNRHFNLLFMVIGVLIVYTLIDAIFFTVIGERLKMIM
jgi:stage II sporulation protein M